MIESYYQDMSSENFAPMLFIMTDGKPSDSQLFKQMVAKVKTMKFGSIVGCVAGPKAKKEYLEEFSDVVVSLETTDSSSFGAFFKWISNRKWFSSATNRFKRLDIRERGDLEYH